jgi:hypothetical protein
MERNVKRKTNWTESLIGVQHDAGVPLTARFSFCCFRYGFRASPSSLSWATDYREILHKGAIPRGPATFHEWQYLFSYFAHGG